MKERSDLELEMSEFENKESVDSEFVGEYVQQLNEMKDLLTEFMHGMDIGQLFQFINLFPFLLEEGALARLIDEDQDYQS